MILWSLGYDLIDLLVSFDLYGVADNSQYEKEKLFEGCYSAKNIFGCNLEVL